MENFPRYRDLHPLFRSDCSFEEVRAMIDQIAASLDQMNLPDQSRVAVVALNSVRSFAALMGIRQAGHVAVPLHINLPVDRIKQLLSDLNVKVVFGDPDRLEGLPTSVRRFSLSEAFRKTEAAAARRAAPPSNDRLALMITTSGSTGTPKVVAIPEKARRAFVLANIARTRLKQKPDAPAPAGGPTVVGTPLSHILAINMTESLFAAKESFVLLPSFKADAFIQTVSEVGASSVSMVPSMWALILQNRELLRSLDLSKVRKIYFSSERLSENLLGEAQRYFPGADIENCYGISEAGPNLFGPHPRGLPRPGVSVGYPRSGFEYRIVDGQLEIKSPFMFQGYAGKDPRADALTEDGFYRTGDQFRVDDNGFYFYLGRIDDLIVSGGKKIYPAEIQAAIEKHPDVVSCAVVSLPDEVKGEKPYAFAVKRDASTLTEEALKAFLHASCPPHLVPRRIWFIPNLPMRPNLKVNTSELKQVAHANLQNGS